MTPEGGVGAITWGMGDGVLGCLDVTEEWIKRSTRCGSGRKDVWAGGKIGRKATVTLGLSSLAFCIACVKVMFARLGPDRLALL